MSRFFLFLFTLSALAWPAVGGERTFGNGTLPEHLAVYDVDESGGLSEEELQVLREDRLHRQKRLRNRWDLDRDGKISDREREAAKARIRKTIEDRRVKRFNEVDLDEDGDLTFGEFRKILAVADADAETPGVARRIFSNLDTDKSDSVSTREFLLKLDTLPTNVVDGNSPPNRHPRTKLRVKPVRPAR